MQMGVSLGMFGIFSYYYINMIQYVNIQNITQKNIQLYIYLYKQPCLYKPPTAIHSINMKDNNHFKLSNSFTSLFAYKGTPSTTSTSGNANQLSSTSTNNKQSGSLDKGLFKLNPKIANSMEDVPVSMLRQKSKNKLESLKDDNTDKKWSIFQQKIQNNKDINTKQKKVQPKKYHIDTTTSKNNNNLTHVQSQNKQIQLAYDIVRPSRLDQINLSSPQQTTSTLFQTPLLPCFSSQFRQNLTTTQFKCVQEKQGVWKIGKIKIKNNKAVLNIGGIQFQASKVDVSGKAGVVAEDNFYQLPHWKSIWVVQPSEEIFK